MHSLVAAKRRELVELCRRFGVERLDLFGSAARGDFRSASSDLDFLVRFIDPAPTGEYAERYLALAEAMERLLGRPVDLITEQSVRNPYFARAVEASRQPVYERQDPEASS
ncbi:MAG: nucleotidyltransferase domain-containing protein [Verrucomicrobiae bacterium]|nr:nucleotidyltransferase domain-containing protein [Verrucomicrobiae bacterium]MDW8310058.1 nucleotidyltransferase domain-containing protein [Verrucomicrobiales bacterium]